MVKSVTIGDQNSIIITGANPIVAVLDSSGAEKWRVENDETDELIIIEDKLVDKNGNIYLAGWQYDNSVKYNPYMRIYDLNGEEIYFSREHGEFGKIDDICFV